MTLFWGPSRMEFGFVRLIVPPPEMVAVRKGCGNCSLFPAPTLIVP
jgi:hypothetical protein